VTTGPSDPVRHARETPELRQALEESCAERGLSTKDARLIHRYSNAVYHLPAEAAVARITSGSLVRAQLAHDLAAWLIECHDVAATAPLTKAPPVQVEDGSVVSFWSYYPQPEGKPAPTSVHLARVLRRLHDVEHMPYQLETWQPLASLSAALADPTAAGNLTDEEHHSHLARGHPVRAGHGVGQCLRGGLRVRPPAVGRISDVIRYAGPGAADRTAASSG
jgi:hypothetical protein